MSKPVLAVIVCYNPELESLSASIEGLLEANCDVLVVDNASLNQKDIIARIASLKDSSKVATNSLEISPQSSNLGLGAAHNIGIQRAKDAGHEYLLLLDQDSIFFAEAVDLLISAHQNKIGQGMKVSAVGASYAHGSQADSLYIRFGVLKFSRHGVADRDSDGCIETDFLISSGSLIAVSTLSELGDMDETLFIDHVDTEWFLRARSKGFKAFGVPAAKMRHGLGEQSHAINLLGRERNVPQHKPFRYYYIFRNSILLYRRRYISGLWKWNDLQRLLLIFFMFALFKAPRWQNMMMMFKGLGHGVLGKSGVLEQKPGPAPAPTGEDK